MDRQIPSPQSGATKLFKMTAPSHPRDKSPRPMNLKVQALADAARQLDKEVPAECRV